MTKAEAIRIFGGTGAALARALGVTSSAVYQWDDELSQERADRVRGAALRLGLIREPEPGCEISDAEAEKAEAA